MGRSIPREEKKGRQRGAWGSLKRRSRPTASPKGVDPKSPRVTTRHRGHVSRACDPTPIEGPQSERGGGRSGLGRRRLRSHPEDDASRPSVPQVPIQGSDAEIAVDVPPIRGAGVPHTLLEDQGPLIILCLGATEDPSGSTQPRQPIRRRLFLDKSKELEPRLKKRSGRRVGRAQTLGNQVGKRRPKSHWQTPEVPVVANAS